ncbi:hypothetical protein [Nocardia sp. NPDC051570]|uniref:hypothetical protein n=1 Tax=Nocardia sp. NPDC051570 TaxID=3364324 RepID=UPI0037906ACF
MIEQGIPLLYWTPSTGQSRTSEEAYFAQLLQMDTSLVAYDADNGVPGPSLTTKGAYVAGTYTD